MAFDRDYFVMAWGFLEEKAMKNGITKVTAGCYLIWDGAIVYTVEKGENREFQGADKRRWFVEHPIFGVVDEFATLRDAKDALMGVR